VSTKIGELSRDDKKKYSVTIKRCIESMHKHNGMMTYAGKGANLTSDTSQRNLPAVGYIHYAPREDASAAPTG